MMGAARCVGANAIGNPVSPMTRAEAASVLPRPSLVLTLLARNVPTRKPVSPVPCRRRRRGGGGAEPNSSQAVNRSRRSMDGTPRNSFYRPMGRLASRDTGGKAATWGFDGLELACWGDHFEV